MQGATIETNGNGHDPRAEQVTPQPEREPEPPFLRPRSAVEISANCAFAAEAAARKASEWSGQAMRAASAAELASKKNSDEIVEVRKDLRAIAKATGAKRTYSGEIVLPSVPPMSQHVSTETGSFKVPSVEYLEQRRALEEQAEALESLQDALALEKAEREGAEKALAVQKAEKKEALERRDAQIRLVTFWILLAGSFATLVTYLATHH